MSPFPHSSRFSRRTLLGGGLSALAAPSIAAPGAAPEFDVVIYGATAAGIAAAVTARRLGKKVALLEPGGRLSAMCANGLGHTDDGRRAAIGGIAREFHQKIRNHYVKTYGAESPQTRDCQDGFRFEPSVALRMLQEMLREAQVPVFYNQGVKAVKRRRNTLDELITATGKTCGSRVFIDASPEGDLMAKAGVRFAVGREGNATYSETLNGVQFSLPFHQFRVNVDPYNRLGDPASGLLPGIQDEDPGTQGQGDHRIQAFCYRTCLTNVASNRRQFPKPQGYDPEAYSLLLRYISAGGWEGLHTADLVPNGKTDTNSLGAFSSDYIGMSYAWPEGDDVTRRKLLRAHADYQQGLLFFLANDLRVPSDIRRQVGEWGLAADEFKENESWPPLLYVREGRRMISDYVMTEHNCRGRVTAENSIALASYPMDSHHVQRVVKDGRVVNEGDVQYAGFPPYPIAYKSITPREEECRNLLVPACLSASHIAYGSIRMEPVFMILGQSAAVAACLAIDKGVSVQTVDPSDLRNRLLNQGQVLDWGRDRSPGTPEGAYGQLVIDPKALKGVIVDDSEAVQDGQWTAALLQNPRRVAAGYLHDRNADKGYLSLTYTPDLPEDRTYTVVMIFPPNPTCAVNVPVTLKVEGVGSQSFKINQRSQDTEGFVTLGAFRLPKGKKTSVTISNKGTQGHVVADAVQFAPN